MKHFDEEDERQLKIRHLPSNPTLPTLPSVSSLAVPSEAESFSVERRRQMNSSSNQLNSNSNQVNSSSSSNVMENGNVVGNNNGSHHELRKSASLLSMTSQVRNICYLLAQMFTTFSATHFNQHLGY